MLARTIACSSSATVPAASATSRRPASPRTSPSPVTSTSASPVRRCRSRWTSSWSAWSRWSPVWPRPSCCSGSAWWAPFVLAGGWLGDPLAAPRERGVARPQHRRGARRATPCRLRLPARRRSTGGQGVAAVRPGRRGRSTASPTGAAASTNSSTGRPGCESDRSSGAWRSCWRQRTGVLVDRRRGRRRPARHRRRASCSCRQPSARRRSRSVGSAGRSTARRRRSPPCDRLEAAMAVGRCTRPRQAPGGRTARPRDPLPRRHFTYPTGDRPGARRVRPHDPGRHVDGHRRGERRRQDHAGQAALPVLRPAGRAPSRSTAIDLRELDAGRRGARRLAAVFQDFVRYELPLARQRGTHRRARRGDPRRAGRRRRVRAGRARHGPARRLPGRHRPVGRPVAARRPGPGAVRGAARAPAWCCSTSRPPSSTSAARRRSSNGCSPPPATARRSSSRTASRRCASPTGSAWSSTAGSSSSARHDELMALGGRYRTMFDLQASRFAEVDERRARRCVHDTLS